MNYPILVGLTGGIGSGKTICASIFKELGIPVYNSDEEAKKLMTSNTQIIDSIKSEFGNESYNPDGSLNRNNLSHQIFQDEKKLEKMNAIVHPVVRQDFIIWAGIHHNAPYVIQESALLIEIGAQNFFDKIILVDAPESIRIQRVIERDATTPSAVKARMSKQLPSPEKRKAANYIIENDGNHGLIRQIIEIHLQLLRQYQVNIST